MENSAQKFPKENLDRFRIRINGIDPEAGELFASFKNKKDADDMVANMRESKFRNFEVVDAGEDITVERTATRNKPLKFLPSIDLNHKKWATGLIVAQSNREDDALNYIATQIYHAIRLNAIKTEPT